MESQMYPRPKRGESEEDLLKLQEEFFKNKAGKKFQPAAKLVGANKASSSASIPSSSINDKPEGDIQEHLENTFEDIPKNARVGKVVAKQTPTEGVSRFKFSRQTGFPQAKRRDPAVSSGTGSLFSQQMKKLKTDQTMDVDPSPINPSSLKITERIPGVQTNIPKESFIVAGSEKNDIHNENVDIMSRMTEAEILEERERLMSTMDPAIIAFLKSKRHHNKPPPETRQPSIAEQNKTSESIHVEDIETTSDILMQPEADKWLNFDVFETSKLAWMKRVDIPKLSKDQQYEARFDFAGWLLPFTDNDISEKNRALYHHGEEPGRPGYTLQELFQLCRSSVTQQKIVALNSVANILSLQSSGIYDDVIDIPVEQIFFVLRFCLDENTPATLTASLKAMRNLFYYTIDETCLDGLLGFGLGVVQPVLPVDNKEVEDDKTVNDQEMAESDLVLCLARTDILVRIRYILNTVQPSIETVVYCLELLTRLVRDSGFVLKRVYECEGLLESIVQHFVPQIFKPGPTNSAYGLPLTAAIKFLRVISSRSKEVAVKLITKFKALDSIATYLSNDFVSTNTNGLKLQIESMHLWYTFVHYGLGIDYFKVLQPILLRLFDYHLRNTDASNSTSYVIQGHIAAFLNLLSGVAAYDYNSILVYLRSLFDVGVPKWCSQFGELMEFTCGKLQLISSLMGLLKSIVKFQPSHVHLPLEKMYQCTNNLLQSKGFQTVTSTIGNGSNILNNYEAHKCSANFKYTEAAVWNASDHVIPIMQTTSCMPFVSSIASFVENCNNTQLKLTLLNHPNIKTYLQTLQSAEKYYLTSNWFTRIESNLVMSLLKTAVTVQRDIDTEIFYAVAVKTLSVFSAEQKPNVEFILKNIVFSTKFYPSDVLMRSLSLNDTAVTLRGCLDNIDEIFEVYIQVLGLRNNIPDHTNNICADINIGNIMPIDWIYSPIIVLYANQQQNTSTIKEQQQTHIVINCLRWVFIYESYFPSLAAMINPTDRYCRLACTFLGSDALFLIPEVRNLLESCLKSVLMTNEGQINFDRTIEGLNNFQDFYTQLLEQYQGVSYGDKLFGNFILIPLAQKHNVKFRKTLWSEYAGIVQIFNVTENELYCPVDLFLEPAERDMSLLKCYRKAMVTNSIRKTSVLYKIAEHHVQSFVAKRKNQE